MYQLIFAEKCSSSAEAVAKYVQNTPEIPSNVMKEINRDITKEEIAEVITGLILTESPGIDGLGSAFYKTFAAGFVPVLAYVYSDILLRTLTPPFMRRALVALSPKKHPMNLTQTDTI